MYAKFQFQFICVDNISKYWYYNNCFSQDKNVNFAYLFLKCDADFSMYFLSFVPRYCENNYIAILFWFMTSVKHSYDFYPFLFIYRMLQCWFFIYEIIFSILWNVQYCHMHFEAIAFLQISYVRSPNAGRSYAHDEPILYLLLGHFMVTDAENIISDGESPAPFSCFPNLTQ